MNSKALTANIKPRLLAGLPSILFNDCRHCFGGPANKRGFMRCGGEDDRK